MSLSIQKMVSDGTLSTIVLGVQYLQRNDVYVRIAGVDTPQSGATSGYTWGFLDNNTIRVLPVVPAGVEVVVYRRTDLDAMYNIYSQNAQFDESTIDENNQQLLYIAQEYFEQGVPVQLIEGVEYTREDTVNVYYRLKLSDGSYTAEFPIPKGGAVGFEALRRSYAEAGLNLVDGSFEEGGTLTSTSDVLLHKASGKAYSGSIGQVAAGTDPAGAGFVDRSGELLRATYFSGPVRSLSQSTFSLSSTMSSATQTARVQGFIDSFILLGGCAVIDQDVVIDDIGVYARSGVDIRFTNESKFTKEPTASQGYGMLFVSGVKNANIYSPYLVGDKYTHLADTGEYGIGLRIGGECENVNIYNPICDEMWGDGIYIGADESGKYPTGVGVSIYNPVCRKNRRQGISYIGGVVRIHSPVCEDTKSSDSRYTLSAGPHAGIDIEPNNADPVIDICIYNPITRRNAGDGILFTPFFIKTAKELAVHITGHIDDGSKHAFRILADNDLFSGFVHYDGFGQNNKLCALYMDAWKKCMGCDVSVTMRAKLWGRDTSSAKFGAAYAWGSSATTDGGVKIRLTCIDTSDKPNVAYHLGPTDLNLQITTDNSNAVSLISSDGSFIDVRVDGPFKKQMTLVNVAYTDFFNSFQVDGAGGNRSLGFESSWFANMRDGGSVEVDAKNCAQLLIQTTASQAGQGGAIIRPDGTLGNYRVTAGPQKVINVRFAKYGYFMMICSVSGGTGANA